MAKKLRIDWFLFAIAAGLALFGAVMVYSASAMISLRETANNPDGATQFQYFFKQFGFTIAGLVVMYLTSKIDYRFWQNKICRVRSFDCHGFTFARGFRFSGDQRRTALDSRSGIFISAVGNGESRFADFSRVVFDEK